MFSLNKSLIFLFGILVLTIAIYPLSFFQSELMPTAGVRSGISLDDNRLSLTLPRTTKVYNDTTVEKDIIQSTFFVDDRLNLRGFIQLWNITDLDAFLSDSRKESPFDFISYSSKPLKIDNLEGYILDWTAVSKTDDLISGREYFLKKSGSDRVLRVSCFTNKGPFSEAQDQPLIQTVTSVVWK